MLYTRDSISKTKWLIQQKTKFEIGLDMIYVHTLGVYCKNINCKVFIHNFNRLAKSLRNLQIKYKESTTATFLYLVNGHQKNHSQQFRECMWALGARQERKELAVHLLRHMLCTSSQTVIKENAQILCADLSQTSILAWLCNLQIFKKKKKKS